MTALLDVHAAEVTFQTNKGPFQALRDIHLKVQQGEFITLIGHSGCGKSTLLNLIAGLLKPTGGALLCDNKEITAPGPERAVVFQNHSLLPWLSCFDNVYLAVERGFGRGVGVKVAVAITLKRRFIKSKKATTSNWMRRRLSDKQVLYAANDAYAAIKVFHVLGSPR